jgi:DNA circularisation protein N-terminus
MNSIFEGFVLGTWEVTGFSIPLPVSRIEEEGGNRLVERERPNRDGAKIDDTGSKAKRWVLTLDYLNGSTEPDFPEDAYPDIVNQLMQSVDVHECGDLTLPHIGKRRCRAHSYRRVEASDERDYALLSVTFVEDNEDGTTASSFQSPSARSVCRTLTEQTTLDCDDAAVDTGTSLGEALNDIAAAVETVMDAPGDFVGQIETVGKQFEAAAGRIEDAGSNAVATFSPPASSSAQPAPLDDPGNSRALRGLRRLRDLGRRAAAERLSAMPRILVLTFAVERSLLDVAAELGQDLGKLIAINAQLENLLAIPPRTPVRVFSNA